MEALRRDPKRAGILGVLLVVLGVLLLRGMFSGGTPSGAAAAPVPGAVAAGLPGQDATALLNASAPAARRAGQEAALRLWLAAPVPAPQRNLFEVRLDYFPLEGGRALAVAEADGTNFWDQLEKSLAWRADQRIKRESLISAFIQEADQIRPTSTIPGQNPKAMINGKLVGEGDVVASFRVLKIEARRILVEREGIRLAIPMK